MRSSSTKWILLSGKSNKQSNHEHYITNSMPIQLCYPEAKVLLCQLWLWHSIHAQHSISTKHSVHAQHSINTKHSVYTQHYCLFGCDRCIDCQSHWGSLHQLQCLSSPL